MRGWLRDLIWPPPEGVYVAQVKAFGANPECVIPPLSLPAIKPLQATPVPKDWIWNREQKRYEAPPKPTRQRKSSVVTPMRRQA